MADVGFCVRLSPDLHSLSCSVPVIALASSGFVGGCMLLSAPPCSALSDLMAWPFIRLVLFLHLDSVLRGWHCHCSRADCVVLVASVSVPWMEHFSVVSRAQVF